MKINVLLIALIALVVVSPFRVEALTLDEFNGNQESISPGGGFSALASPQVVGGTRKIFTINNNPTLGFLRGVVGLGVFSHNQDSRVTGLSSTIWDSSTGFTTNYSGLNGIDLLQDAGTAFRLDLVFLDESGSLSIILYDSRDVSGNTWSSSSLTLTGPLNNQSFSIPFTSFEDSGPNGPVDFKSIGAIEMRISSTLPATDITIDALTTNGFCPLVPSTQGRVVDECGVCGGDNTSCADCAGVPNGSAVLDRCNVCAGDGQSCLGCNIKDLTPLLTALDGGAKDQEHLIRAVLKQVDASTKDRKVRARTAKIRKIVHELQIRNWVLSWQVPRYLNECTNEVFCASVSTEPKISEYRIHSEELRQYMQVSVKLLRSVRKKGNGYFQKYINKADQQHANNMALADSVPARHMTCE